MKTSAAASRISRREDSGSRPLPRLPARDSLLRFAELMAGDRRSRPGASARAQWRPASPLCLHLAADGAAQHQALDLRGALVDLQDALVAVEAFHLGGLAVAVAGPDLHGHIGSLVCDLGAEELRLGADHLHVLAAVIGLGRAVKQQA